MSYVAQGGFGGKKRPSEGKPSGFPTPRQGGRPYSGGASSGAGSTARVKKKHGAKARARPRCLLRARLRPRARWGEAQGSSPQGWLGAPGCPRLPFAGSGGSICHPYPSIATWVILECLAANPESCPVVDINVRGDIENHRANGGKMKPDSFAR